MYWCVCVYLCVSVRQCCPAMLKLCDSFPMCACACVCVCVSVQLWSMHWHRQSGSAVSNGVSSQTKKTSDVRDRKTNMNIHARAALPVTLLPDYATARVRRTHTATTIEIEIEACNCNKARWACTTTCYSLTVTASLFSQREARYDSILLSSHNCGLPIKESLVVIKLY